MVRGPTRLNSELLCFKWSGVRHDSCSELVCFKWAARPPALENPVLHPWHLKGITLGGGRFLAALWKLKIANITKISKGGGGNREKQGTCVAYVLGCNVHKASQSSTYLSRPTPATQHGCHLMCKQTSGKISLTEFPGRLRESSAGRYLTLYIIGRSKSADTDTGR